MDHFMGSQSVSLVSLPIPGVIQYLNFYIHLSIYPSIHMHIHTDTYIIYLLYNIYVLYIWGCVCVNQ